ncbi:hypothetical protein F5Y08DRAFT_323056 [Xylaria arbuscula]|nr:hypothetical protein F5Y08DRAFT_323056 [Xylaria arbuscula]
MQLSIVTLATVVATVSALPGPLPVITAAPEAKDVYTAATSSAACSTDCWASYVECNHSLTFVYLCYTPPPCGTQTSPSPYHCPTPKTTTTIASPSPSTLPSYTISSKPASAKPTAYD